MSQAARAVPTFRMRVGNILDRWPVLMRLMRGALKVKYEGSALGYAWSVLEPLLLAGVYYLVFGLILNVSRGIDDYILFLIAGLLPWQWLSTTVNGSLKALRDNGRLITKVYVPREIFPLATVGAKTVEFLLSLFVLLPIALVFQHAPSWQIVYVIPAMLLQLMLLTGISLILAPANTLLRDIERVLSPVMRMLFYFSPILYSVKVVFEKDLPHVVKVLYHINPVTGILELYRAGWYPNDFLGWTIVGISAAGCVIVLLFGWWLFLRLEPHVLKEM